jgi:hypothetical protein
LHTTSPRAGKGPAGLRARGGWNDGYTNTSHSFVPASLIGCGGGRRVGGYDHNPSRRTFFRPSVEGTSPCQATSAIPDRHRLHLRRVVAVQRIRLLRLHALDIPQSRRRAPALVDGTVPSCRRERERPHKQARAPEGWRPRLPQNDERARRSCRHIRGAREVHLVDFLEGSSPTVDLGSLLLGAALGGSSQAARHPLGASRSRSRGCATRRYSQAGGRAPRGAASTSRSRMARRTSCTGSTRLACCGADIRRRPLPTPRPPDQMTPSP